MRFFLNRFSLACKETRFWYVVPMTLETLKKRLQETFLDGKIQVHDLTGGEDHFQVSVESKTFKGLTRIQQHQKVMSVFEPELKSGEIHALSLQTKIME